MFCSQVCLPLLPSSVFLPPVAGFSHILHRGPSPVSDRASPDALPRHRRPPKLGSRDKRPLRERPASEPGRWFGVEGVPPGPLPGASAGPSSGSSEDGSVCGDPGDDWLHDPGLRGLSSSDDGTECGGWRRELDVDEVCEYYMDAKFGGEDADMGEIMMW